jgi:hypothetical protein
MTAICRVDKGLASADVSSIETSLTLSSHTFTASKDVLYAVLYSQAISLYFVASSSLARISSANLRPEHSKDTYNRM